MTDIKSFMEQTEAVLLHTYGKTPIVLEHGENVFLYDTQGNQYLDFASGIAVCSLGYSNEYFKEQLKMQIDKLLHTSNLFYNEWAGKAGEAICQVSGMDRVFFTNSGTEAIEGALKLARKYFYQTRKRAGGKIIAMESSFHGRSMGALSVTGQEKYRAAFEPLIGGVDFARFNDLESIKALITEDTCAVILETIQGEGGIYPAEKEFLTELRTLCTEKDIVLILDEIQCGMGRCGSYYAYEQYGIKPDILTTAKALGCGVPVGAFAAKEKIASAMVLGDHGTTYGGNPFACAAVCAVFACYEKENIINHSKEMGNYFKQKLEELKISCPHIIAHRGMGLMRGLELDTPVQPYLEEARKKGLIIISAGATIIRLVPPLVIQKEHIDQMCDILKEILC